MSREAGFVAIWEFRVHKGTAARFEEVYGPTGTWGTFFRAGNGYLGTELIRDLSVQGRYVTLDFWTSKEAYDAFRGEYSARYHELDAECEDLTESEQEIGQFARVSDGGRTGP